MLPSKDLIYPEYLPINTKYQENNSPRAYDYYSKAFAENGIQHLDIVSHLKKIKDKVDYPLFPKAGMHWSNIACAHASDTIIRYMEHLCGKNLPNIEVGKTYLAKTRRYDNDMAKLLNIASKKMYRKNYYADVVMISLSATQLYNLNHGFISQSIINLSLDDSEAINSILTKIKNNIKNNENRFNSIKNKAKTKGISVEESLHQDALYILNSEPEKYLQ